MTAKSSAPKIKYSASAELVRKYGFFPTLKRQWQWVVLSVPFLAFIIFNNYVPIWGWTYAFFEASQKTMLPDFSKFTGISMFTKAFGTEKFFLALRNTLAISVLKMVLGFVTSIGFAIMLNEIRIKWFKKTVQTISYLPHFVSWVIAASLVSLALSPDGGVINIILVGLGVIDKPINFLMINGPAFWIIAAVSEIWKEVGWNAIIYLAAMTGIDPEQYEAAQIDGAGRLKRIMYITLPGIAPTIKMLLILSVGNLFVAGFEQMLLLQKPYTYDYSEILDTYVYKYVWASDNPGRMYKNLGYGTAVGMMNSIVSCILVLSANRIAKAIDGEALF